MITEQQRPLKAAGRTRQDMSTATGKVLHLLFVAGCTQIIHDPQPPAVDHVVMPCLDVAPPKPPAYAPCVDLEHECRDLRNAQRADYAEELQRWVELYAWPSCSDATASGSDRYAEHARPAAVPARPDERP